jgi:hypothetical protein
MIPVTDGLLPEPYNAQLLVLLYRLAEWHALAKLRMHTEPTLQGLDMATTGIGRELRSFREWSRESFTVKKLPSESNARRTRRQKARATQGGSSLQPGAVMNPLTATSDSSLSSPATAARTLQTVMNDGAAESTALEASAPTPTVGASTAGTDTLKTPAKVQILNLFTYKLHALGDYVRTIRAFGTTDSYSTQTVCCFA